MASTGTFELVRAHSTPLLRGADVIAFVDTADPTQAAWGSLVAITLTDYFAAIPVPIVVTSTSTQLQLKYDGSNHVTVAVSSAGVVTLNATGASAGFTFSDPVTFSAAAIALSSVVTPVLTTSSGAVPLVIQNGGTTILTLSTLSAILDANIDLVVNNPSITLGAGSGSELAMLGWSATNKNWQVSTHIIGTGIGLAFTPSTTAGGSTFTTAVAVLGETGSLTLAGQIATTLTTQQLSLKYDPSNHLAVTVASDGLTTFNATGAGAAFEFADSVTFDSRALIADGAVNAPSVAFAAASGIGFYRQGAATAGATASATAESFRWDNSVTATQTRFLVYDVDKGAISRVTVGANDSGGAGFKVLRVPN